MKLFSCLESLRNLKPISSVLLEEFDKARHMSFAKDVMDMDEELSASQRTYNPGPINDDYSFGKISYEKYIDLMVQNRHRLFIAILNEMCIGYVSAVPSMYKGTMYLSSLIVSKKFTGKGYGKSMLTQFEALIKNEYDSIILVVAIANKPAVNLYTHDGFHPTHTTMFKKLK